MANITCSTEGFSFLILEEQSWSFPKKGFYAVLMTASGYSVSVKVVGLQDAATVTESSSLSA